MKKISIIFLLSVFAFNQVAIFSVFLYMQHRVKEQMMEEVRARIGLNDMEAICLSGNEQNIEWEEEGREFSYNGEMYDLVRSAKVNGKTILYCLNDKKEMQLLQQYRAAEKHSNENKKTKNLDNQVTLYIDVEAGFNAFTQLKNKDVFPRLTSRLSPGTTGILSPPPKTHS